ncbi:TRC40/GET3/ArsA family transport-energizing ATPase [uncultured Sphaerochaeta sp.]|uniref:TRC40/GET3/ArsA family transport-energizing ATPase n=1 Tax=uncultured Sphaerochaeta sp. TaxID=886478 RepID=UPI002A0A8829|nr:TRC40/GET3/ArsA family transport-energizing ATPase [uncultured Sphaerochaeta sp.]
MAHLHIFIGKGGVGKSTCSSLEALRFAQDTKKDIQLVSMDPAHNLHDLFERKLSPRQTRVLPNLAVKEFDLEKQSREYMASTQQELKGLYHYQQALNIDKYFNILKFAPGMEEYASLLVLEKCFKEKKFDEIIIDTPPTALTLKTLALPSINLHWVTQLMNMREEIVQKKNCVANIRKENLNTLEEDPIYRRLLHMQERYTALNEKLQDTAFTEIVLVMNEDELSFAESLMIQKQLKILEIKISKVIINKSTGLTERARLISTSFSEASIELVPLENNLLQGVENLGMFSKKISIFQ